MRMGTSLRIVLALTLHVAVVSAAAHAQTIDRVTCDRGAPCPRQIEIAAGGSATIVLNGTQLDLLMSGTVVDGRGAPANDLTVRMAPAVGGTRSITVTAGAGAQALSGLQLLFGARTQRQVAAPVDLAIVQAQPGGQATVPVTRGTPVVGSDTPILVDLEPGESQTVLLEGSNLDLLAGAMVRQNSFNVTNVTAALQPTSNPSRREVRLTAASTSVPPWNVPLTLQVTAEPGGALETPVQVQVVMADLVIESVYASLSGRDHFNATVTIRNQGKAAAVFPPGVAVYRVATGSLSPLIGNSGNGNTIQPGSAGPWGPVSGGPLPVGTSDFTVVVDPFNLVSESNETNNQDTANLTVAPPEPANPGAAGLTITSVTHDPADAAGSEQYTFIVTVRNDGSTPAEGIVREGSSGHCLDRVEPTGPLQPGETRQLSDPQWVTAAVRSAGTHTCSFALADGSNEPTLPGSEFEYTYTIPGPPPPPPDLHITGIEIFCPTSANGCDDPGHVMGFDEYWFRVSVQNLGPGTQWRDTVPITITAEGCGIIPKQSTFYTYLPGEVRTLTVTPGPALMTPGSRMCTFRVDREGEADTTNNTRPFTWTIY